MNKKLSYMIISAIIFFLAVVLVPIAAVYVWLNREPVTTFTLPPETNVVEHEGTDLQRQINLFKNASSKIRDEELKKEVNSKKELTPEQLGFIPPKLPQGVIAKYTLPEIYNNGSIHVHVELTDPTGKVYNNETDFALTPPISSSRTMDEIQDIMTSFPADEVTPSHIGLSFAPLQEDMQAQIEANENEDHDAYNINFNDKTTMVGPRDGRSLDVWRAFLTSSYASTKFTADLVADLGTKTEVTAKELGFVEPAIWRTDWVHAKYHITPYAGSGNLQVDFELTRKGVKQPTNNVGSFTLIPRPPFSLAPWIESLGDDVQSTIYAPVLKTLIDGNTTPTADELGFSEPANWQTDGIHAHYKVKPYSGTGPLEIEITLSKDRMTEVVYNVANFRLLPKPPMSLKPFADLIKDKYDSYRHAVHIQRAIGQRTNPTWEELGIECPVSWDADGITSELTIAPYNNVGDIRVSYVLAKNGVPSITDNTGSFIVAPLPPTSLMQWKKVLQDEYNSAKYSVELKADLGTRTTVDVSDLGIKEPKAWKANGVTATYTIEPYAGTGDILVSFDIEIAGETVIQDNTGTFIVHPKPPMSLHDWDAEVANTYNSQKYGVELKASLGTKTTVTAADLGLVEPSDWAADGISATYTIEPYAGGGNIDVSYTLSKAGEAEVTDNTGVFSVLPKPPMSLRDYSDELKETYDATKYSVELKADLGTRINIDMSDLTLSNPADWAANGITAQFLIAEYNGGDITVNYTLSKTGIPEVQDNSGTFIVHPKPPMSLKAWSDELSAEYIATKYSTDLKADLGHNTNVDFPDLTISPPSDWTADGITHKLLIEEYVSGDIEVTYELAKTGEAEVADNTGTFIVHPKPPMSLKTWADELHASYTIGQHVSEIQKALNLKYDTPWGVKEGSQIREIREFESFGLQVGWNGMRPTFQFKLNGLNHGSPLANGGDQIAAGRRNFWDNNAQSANLEHTYDFGNGIKIKLSLTGMKINADKTISISGAKLTSIGATPTVASNNIAFVPITVAGGICEIDSTNAAWADIKTKFLDSVKLQQKNKMDITLSDVTLSDPSDWTTDGITSKFTIEPYDGGDLLVKYVLDKPSESEVTDNTGSFIIHPKPPLSLKPWADELADSYTAKKYSTEQKGIYMETGKFTTPFGLKDKAVANKILAIQSIGINVAWNVWTPTFTFRINGHADGAPLVNGGRFKKPGNRNFWDGHANNERNNLEHIYDLGDGMRVKLKMTGITTDIHGNLRMDSSTLTTMGVTPEVSAPINWGLIYYIKWTTDLPINAAGMSSVKHTFIDATKPDVVQEVWTLAELGLTEPADWAADGITSRFTINPYSGGDLIVNYELLKPGTAEVSDNKGTFIIHPKPPMSLKPYGDELKDITVSEDELDMETFLKGKTTVTPSDLHFTEPADWAVDGVSAVSYTVDQYSGVGPITVHYTLQKPNELEVQDTEGTFIVTPKLSASMIKFKMKPSYTSTWTATPLNARLKGLTSGDCDLLGIVDKATFDRFTKYGVTVSLTFDDVVRTPGTPTTVHYTLSRKGVATPTDNTGTFTFMVREPISMTPNIQLFEAHSAAPTEWMPDGFAPFHALMFPEGHMDWSKVVIGQAISEADMHVGHIDWGEGVTATYSVSPTTRASAYYGFTVDVVLTMDNGQDVQDNTYTFWIRDPLMKELGVFMYKNNPGVITRAEAEKAWQGLIGYDLAVRQEFMVCSVHYNDGQYVFVPANGHLDNHDQFIAAFMSAKFVTHRK